MHLYMGYVDDSSEGAVLVFATSAREAKRLAYPYMSDFWEAEYIDTRVKRLRGKDFLYLEADQSKLKQGISHVIDAPASCVECHLWGVSPLVNDLCEDCREAEGSQDAE